MNMKNSKRHLKLKNYLSNTGILLINLYNLMV